MELFDREAVSPEQAWLGTFVASVVAIVAAAVAFTEQVYYGFLWRYFWGPVRADAEGAGCFVHLPDSGQTVPGETAQGCSQAAYETTAFIAEPGYTVLSTASYILVLVFMLSGIYLLLQRMDLRPHKQFFYALVPFMLFGGALRTVEDAFVAALRAGQTPALEFPASAAFISPFIYFTVFAIALASFFASKLLARRGLTDGYTAPFAAIGVAWLAGAFGYVFVLSVTTDYVSFHPTVLVAILGLASLSAAGVYLAAREWQPSIHAGTGLVGLVVLWGHAVDGFANVVATDWTHIWNLGLEYTPKHPFNAFIIETTQGIQGGDAIAGIYVGTAWPFAVVKLAVPLLIVALFDREFIEESPRFAIMLLGAIVAVGRGPGARDMLRIAFGL